jgi:Txe/YoeB family toxin of Txe-Axe toxin-antitoxin module
MEAGTPYLEPGYTSTDDRDGDITANVLVTGSVDHTVLGSYTLHYNVTDSSGNPAEEKVRTVNVVDRTPPVISLLGDNPMILEMGTPYLEPGYTATDNYDGDITGNVEITGSVTYTVRYNVVDSSSNPAEEQARTVNVLDTTPFDIAGIVEPVTGMVQLTWSSRLGETFVVWSCNDLCAGPWRQEATLPARYEFTNWVDPEAAVSKMKFYRIQRQ